MSLGTWFTLFSVEFSPHVLPLLSFPAWSMAFGPGEVAVDEAVSMDASDVGWGDTPTTTADTGWATFDSFTDIRMAPSRCELDMTISHVQPGPFLKYLAK